MRVWSANVLEYPGTAGPRGRRERGFLCRGGLGGLVVLAFAMILAGASGCATPQARKLSPADAAQFAPLPLPPDFDRQRALCSLGKIPADPPAPTAAELIGAEAPNKRISQRLAEARKLFADKHYTDTIIKLDQVLGSDANNHEAHRLMAVALLLSGNASRAELFADRALAIKPDDLACHYVLGRLADKAKKVDQALSKYRTALKCSPADRDQSFQILTHYYLGTLLFRRGYYTAAIEQFNAFETGVQSLGKRIAENPELTTVVRTKRSSSVLQVAKAYALLGQYPAAADALKLAVDQSPEDFELQAEYVRMLVRAGRTADAAEQATALVADSKGEQSAVQLLLAVHRFAGHPERGVSAVQEIAAQQPDNIELQLLYTDALASANRYLEAANALEELIRQQPDAVEPRWKLAELHRSRGDFSAWLRTLAEELAIRPDGYRRASVELDQLPLSTARNLVDEAVGKAPAKKALIPQDLPDDQAAGALDYLLGRLCARLERIDDAKFMFTRSAQRTAEFLPTTIGLAELYVRRCRWKEALEVIDAVEQTRKPAYQLERLLGRCYDGLDDIEKSVTHYEKAIELNPTAVGSMLLLGKLYERVGQLARARQQYQSVVAADPQNLRAREALIRIFLVQMQSRSRGRDQRSILGRVFSELSEMQRLGPRNPATIRSAAVIKFLTPHNPDFRAYSQALRKLIELRPEDLRSREELVAALVALREYESARVELAEILTRDAYNPEANELMVLVLTRLLNFDKAGERLERMLTWFPNRQTWIQNLAELRVIEQDYTPAIALWERLLSFQDRPARKAAYRVRLMQTYRFAKRFDEAREIAETWLAEAGTEVTDRYRSLLRYLLLAADAGAKDYSRYIERCRQWLAEDPNNQNVRGWLLGLRDVAHFPSGSPGPIPHDGGLLATKSFDEAALVTLDWLAENPGEVSLVAWVIEVMQASKGYDEAIEFARSHVSAADKPAERLRRLDALVSVYMRAKHYDEAVDTLDEVINEAPEFVSPALLEDYLFNRQETLSRILTQAKRFDDAIDQLNKMIDKLEDRLQQIQAMGQKERGRRSQNQLANQAESDRRRKAELLRLLSYTYQQQGRFGLAELRIREAYRLWPSSVAINNDLGYALADAGKELDKAERMIRLAVGEEPRRPAYMDSLGWLFYKTGRLAEARTWLTRASLLEEGQDPVIYDHLGDVQWRMGQKNAAVESWNRSLEIHNQRVAEDFENPDEKLVTRIKGKLQAAVGGEKEPELAPIVTETKPAP